MAVDLKKRLVHKGLLRRSDALGHAVDCVRCLPHPEPPSLRQARMVRIVEELHREADEAFRRYREGLVVPRDNIGPFPH
jgi:hypothetical protein